jgi:hypothetical protein
MDPVALRRVRAALAVLAAAAAMPASAWHEDGHRRALGLAMDAAGPALPAFFAAGRAQAMASASDPDLFRERSSPLLREQESPEHHFDWERLGGAVPPTNRYDFVALCAERRIDPSAVGFLPYAVIAWTERLARAFSEHRAWPRNEEIMAKCLVYAGLLSHYAGDLTQPLHVTADYDGRPGRDGAPAHTGIHSRMDALLGKAAPAAALPRASPAPFPDLAAGVFAELDRSRRLVDRVYALRAALPAATEPIGADPELSAFAADRLRAAAAFVARLYLTAWERSAELPAPPWHQEPAVKADAEPAGVSNEPRKGS